jgi:5-methylcytosine-specific restriction enzyme B
VTFARVLREDIIPLLEEYCYEDYSALREILGEGLVDVKNQRIRHELFEIGQEDELRQKLLSAFPEIATLPRSVAAEAEAEDDLDGADAEPEDE